MGLWTEFGEAFTDSKESLSVQTWVPLTERPFRCPRHWAVWLGLVIFTVSGCRSLALPQLFEPAPLSYQLRRAEQFDPFPENEPGPTVVGSRPREFDRPLPEARRAKLLPWWARPAR